MTTAAEKTLEAIGNIPIPVEKVEGGVKLGEGYQALMRAYDAAQQAVDEERK